jgi:pilus assembly protein Flp/PilA
MPRRLASSRRRACAFARRFGGDTRAATAIEYGMILAVIVLVWFVALTQFSGTTVRLWDDIMTRVTKAR